MNVIISNKNQALLENLGIDVIKEMNGEFRVEEIVATFQNYFYQRMILDITAIANYTDISNMQKLSMALDMEKLILLLDGTDATSNPNFLSNLVSMGIYNFTTNIEGIQYLYNTPNTYRDVAQFQNIAPQDSMSQLAPQVLTAPTVEMQKTGPIIIGVKNVTKQSGASSLVYMMKNQLAKNYDVVALEIDKGDFTYFKDRDMISTITSDVGSIINRFKNKEIILIDINNSMVAEGFCQDVLYLIEPSILKLQKLMALNAPALYGLKGKKVILNQSLLSSNDVATFEYEAKVKVFYNLVPISDRDKNPVELNKMLVKLGFAKQKSEI